jgi:hypothetical protein
MRNLFAAGACALGLLAFAGPAAAGVSIGVNDDSGKYAGGDPQFWTTMQANGLKQDAVTVLWDETQPTTILDEGFIASALPAAAEAGIEVVFDVYPMHSQAFTDNGATPGQFADFLTKLAQTFPTVTDYVVMNECNQTRFVNPQFNAAGVNQSAALCGRALAAGYDALKAVDPDIFVWGVGLSPRGNDNAAAASNVSTSPVRFLAALGQWYRASGRTMPIMDGFDFHPYPIPQSLPFATGYTDVDNAAVSNLRRIYQAFYDAFKGTAQPTIGQQLGGGLPVSLNEVGIQTDNTGRPEYTGVETSGDGNGGVRGETGTERFQSDWYLQMLNLVACDANIKVANIFHLVDESDLAGWQSGLYYVGYAPKASAAAIQSWIATTGGNCVGWGKGWIAGGSNGGSTPRVRSALGISTSGRLAALFSTRFTATLNAASLRGFVNVLSQQLGPAKADANANVSLLFVGSATTASARGLASAAGKPVASATAIVKKGNKLSVALRVAKLTPGYYRLRYGLRAVKGGARATVTTKAFYLLGNGKLAR